MRPQLSIQPSNQFQLWLLLTLATLLMLSAFGSLAQAKINAVPVADPELNVFYHLQRDYVLVASADGSHGFDTRLLPGGSAEVKYLATALLPDATGYKVTVRLADGEIAYFYIRNLAELDRCLVPLAKFNNGIAF